MALRNLTEEELMQKISHNDADAFQELLFRYEKKVFSLAWRLCLNQPEAEDLTQETFLKIWRNAKLWKQEAKLETWIYRILYNSFIDVRRRTKESTEEPTEVLYSNDDSPEQTLIKKQESQTIANALKELPERQKEALVLCYYQGMKAKEAAEVLSVSQSALEALLFRARQTLKDKLNKRERKEGKK